MNISELIQETEAEELAALSQFFVGRADDKNTSGKLDVDAFVELANQLGMNVDPETLQDMVTQNDIGGIADVSDDEVNFNAQDKEAPDVMTKDKAEMTMQQAAKRAASKRSK